MSSERVRGGRQWHLDAIVAKFGAEGQPITRDTIPLVLGNVVLAKAMIKLALEALEAGEIVEVTE